MVAAVVAQVAAVAAVAAGAAAGAAVQRHPRPRPRTAVVRAAVRAAARPTLAAATVAPTTVAAVLRHRLLLFVRPRTRWCAAAESHPFKVVVAIIVINQLAASVAEIRRLAKEL